ncbi:c-type cytochrome [Billgrantia ethanolica]|uniref:Cytochrome c4 n=1 Tax=Billgrantia ethanolica TaxID=2733486 RepID=A0ABS9A4J9_9GAMM|nr:c-type cytochrome [Halomonas ethanolica]MCE8003733.1 cytochrome c4 [Halomonas ethanolica]
MRRDGRTLPWQRLPIVSTGLAGLLLALPVWSESGPAAGLPLEAQVQVCAACHGEDGNSTRENTPSLAGQPALAITNQMIYFRERLRRSDEMTPQARGLSDAEIQALAAYYAEQPVATPEGERDEALADKGRALSRQQRCASCHGSGYQGREQMPRLAGQREDYLAYAMKAYRERTRGGPDTTMIDIMRGVDNEAIEAMAHFFANLDRE